MWHVPLTLPLSALHIALTGLECCSLCVTPHTTHGSAARMIHHLGTHDAGVVADFMYCCCGSACCKAAATALLRLHEASSCDPHHHRGTLDGLPTLLCVCWLTTRQQSTGCLPAASDFKLEISLKSPLKWLLLLSRFVSSGSHHHLDNCLQGSPDSFTRENLYGPTR